MTHRAWSEYRDALDELFERGGLRFAAVQVELCPTTQRLHVQGAIELTNKKRESWFHQNAPFQKDSINGLMTDPWLRSRGKNAQDHQWAGYGQDRTKEGVPDDYPLYLRGISTPQGTRNDLKDAYKKMREGATMRDLLDGDTATAVRNLGALKKVGLYNKPTVKTRDFEVYIIQGQPGTGKTEKPYRLILGEDVDLYASTAPDIYEKEPEDKWFDGYDGEKHILLDEFRGERSGLTLEMFLRLTGDKRMHLQEKGATLWRRAEKIWITTVAHPKLWYAWNDIDGAFDQLQRRVTAVYRPTEIQYQFQRIERGTLEFDLYFKGLL